MKKLLLILLFLIGTQIQATTLRIIGVGDLYTLNPDKQGRGGYAKLAKLVKDSRQNFDHVLFIHAGDAYSPSLEASILKGMQAVELLNSMDVDYFTPGNHEFDFGPERYKELVAASNFKTIVSNLINESGQRDSNVLRKDMVELSGYKIGIYGLITPRSEILSTMGGYRFKELGVTAKKMHDLLKSEGAEFIIAISHTNVAEDLLLYNSNVSDVLVSGDDHHTIAYSNGKTFWFESGEDAEKITVLDLKFSRDKKGRVRTDGNFSIIDTASLEADPVIQGKIDVITEKIDRELAIELATVVHPLDSRRSTVRGVESNIGNLIADAMKAGTNSDIGFTNGGGIRGNKIYDEGTKLTRKDVLTELPFGNVVVKVELTGADIVTALENGVSKVEDGAGRFPQVSGLTFEFSRNNPAGKRVSNVRVNGTKIDDRKTYTVATNDYIQNGGDGYTSLKGGRTIIDASGATLMATMVMDYVSSLGKVNYQSEGRIIVK